MIILFVKVWKTRLSHRCIGKSRDMYLLQIDLKFQQCINQGMGNKRQKTLLCQNVLGFVEHRKVVTLKNSSRQTSYLLHILMGRTE